MTLQDLCATDGISNRVTGLETRVCQRTAEVCGEEIGSLLSSIVLTGSMARGEATSIEEGGIARVLGDAEFFLVFKRQASLPSRDNLSLLADKIQGRLSNDGVHCHIDLAPVQTRYFRRLQPSIFGYELRACSRVAWGDPSVLELIPPFSAADIPREDAWRLLLNRTIECLEVVPKSLQGGGTSPQEFSYRVTKLCLDMATSYLVFAGEFRPTYSARAQALSEMAQRDEVLRTCPLDLRSFSQQVERCTALKLGGAHAAAFLTRVEAFAQIIEQVRLLWRWELSQLTGSASTATDWELMERRMRRQAPTARLRGWLVVLRGCGWHRSWRNWPRWLMLAHRASPRYWVYAVASELFFSISQVLEPERAELPSESLGFAHLFQSTRNRQEISPWTVRGSALPVVPQYSNQTNSPEWIKLAGSVAANYHRFLEHTES